MNKPVLSFLLLSGLSLSPAFTSGVMAQNSPVTFHTFLHKYEGLNPNSSIPTGTFPDAIKKAYGFDQIAGDGTGQTIALVDAFDYPSAEADLGVFTAQFGLPSCTTSNGCFTKLYATGTKPAGDAGWAQEMALDVQWAHAIAPGAKILLVEAASNSDRDLLTGVVAAVQNGATVVSMSWGGGELSTEANLKMFYAPGVTFFASSGDSGTGAQFPAAHPGVIGVGGTTLKLKSDNTIKSEVAWSGSGGGLSKYVGEPNYQLPYQTKGKRGVPDVAYDSDPATGFPVYDTYQTNGWAQFGGTSDAAPQWAGLVAIANQLRVTAGKSNLTIPIKSVYGLTQIPFHDIVSGNNGSCGAICNATAGYDFVTGLGSPKADQVINAFVALP